MRYAVVMAGGAGRRLWPMSRKNYPKQLLRLAGDSSLLEIAVDRLQGLFDPECIYIITNGEYADLVSGQLKQLPPENVIPEPEGRDTCNAIALMAEILSGKDEDGTMAVFTADHIIRPEEQFREVVSGALKAAETNPAALLTFGIRPTWPHTGLGYVRRGNEISDGVYKVRSFHEKPDQETARKFLGGGDYYWNSGIFVWTLRAISDALRSLVPDAAAKLAPVSEAVRKGEDYLPLIEEIYPTLEKISIDYAVMEKADEVIMVELPCEWIDLGSWSSLEDVIDSDDCGNVLRAKDCRIMGGSNNIIVSSEDDHLVALLGVEDCIVVHTPDATLVCRRSEGQHIKEMVESVEENFDGKYI